ncbi:MAG: methyltransferase domain-containing protein [Chloroflexota bacterium]|nr:methyltransferase domain-containing protein [Chloroflexota bacterium]
MKGKAPTTSVVARATGPLGWPTPPTGYPLTLSHAQLRPLLAAWEAAAGAELAASASPDLGLSTVAVTLSEAGATFPGGERVAWKTARRIIATPNQCFTITDGAAQAIAQFSETTGTLRSLMPTAGAPTTLVSGFSMHRIKGTEPWADTQAKAQAVAPLTGRALDTTTGLGYTAILAARTASEVVTIELDPTALEIARQNPWSHELFERPNIQRIVGDAFEAIGEQRESSFDRVIHDPPYLTLAGELYSEEMYRRLWRVLRRGGRLFHYIGDPRSASGARTTAGVARRLEAAGFTRVTRRPEAFGVVAVK